MLLPRRLPLALRQLTDSPIKTSAAAAGICFANVLVFFQLGLLNGLYESQARPYAFLDGEIVLVSSRFSRLSQTPLILLNDVMRAQGLEGVAHVSSLSIDLGPILLLPEGYTTNAQIYAIDPSNPAINLEKSKVDLALIRQYERVAIDNLSRPSTISSIVSNLRDGRFYRTNLRGKRLIINSMASIGATFAADLSIVMSQDNLIHYYSNRTPSLINIGVIKLKKGYSVARVLAALQDRLYPPGYSIKALSIQDVSEAEILYWKKNTSLTFILGLGVVVGLVVSGIILYQILYSDVTNHLSEYATLLALGYSNIFVIRVVFVQAVLLVLISFPFAVLFSFGLYSLIASSTGLLVSMPFSRIILVLLSTLSTSTFSCYLATNKLRNVDPSTLY
jgi:putative ABC transport system permease protein